MSPRSQQHSLSLPALIEELRKRTPTEKHGPLTALELHGDKAEVQRKLCGIVGRDIVNSAVLHLLSFDASAAGASLTSDVDVCGLRGGQTKGELWETTGELGISSDGGPEASGPTGARALALPPGMSEDDLLALSSSLAHAAGCRQHACPQPDCAEMKAKLHKLRQHASSCRQHACVICQICRTAGSTWRAATAAGAAPAGGSAGGGLGGGGLGVGGNCAGSGAGNEAASPLRAKLEPPQLAPPAFPPDMSTNRGGWAAGTGLASAEPHQRRERRKVLLAHVFSCMQPHCSFPQCAAMRRKLHALVPHTNECDDPHCAHCKIWAIYQHRLCKAAAEQQEATLRAAMLTPASHFGLQGEEGLGGVSREVGGLGGRAGWRGGGMGWLGGSGGPHSLDMLQRLGGSTMRPTFGRGRDVHLEGELDLDHLSTDLGELGPAAAPGWRPHLSMASAYGVARVQADCGPACGGRGLSGEGSMSACLGGLSGEYQAIAALGGLSGDWGALAFNGSMSIDRIFDASLAAEVAPGESFDPEPSRAAGSGRQAGAPKKRRKADGPAVPPKSARLGGTPGGGTSEQLGERVVVRTREMLGAEMPMPESAPEWVAARVVRQSGGRALLRAETPPHAPAALSLAMQACAARWIPLKAAGGELLVRPLDPAVDGPLLGPEHDQPQFEMAAGCPIEVAGEVGWEVGEVLGRSSRTGLYTVKVALDPLLPEAERAAAGGPAVASEAAAAPAAAPAAPQPSRTVHDVRPSALRLRCCDDGCRKHSLLMQRPPADCDMCGRPLQHPMRSSWEYQADMAEAIQFGITSAQLCSQCYKEQRTAAEGRPAASAPSRGPSTPPALATAVVTLGARQVPLAGFVEVPIRQRRQLSDEAPEDSEQQNWVQCAGCKMWQHWVCALYNPRIHESRGAAGGQPTGGSAGDRQSAAPPPWMCRGCLVAVAGGDGIDDPPRESDWLPECELSRQLQVGVAAALAAAGVACEPVAVRVVSSVESSTKAKEEMVQREWSCGEAYPSEFPYRSRGILAFQKIDGRDVAIFMMYAQEYNAHCPQPNTRRVYISYVDSVRYFRSTPAGHRSTAYRALLCAYLDTCRMRGFERVHLWIEPPRANDEYIFYARPPEERRPMKRDKLRSWYCKMLDKAKADGVVERYGTMLEEFRDIKSARQIPLFKGDQWEITVPALLQGEEAPAAAAVEDAFNVSLARSVSERGPHVPTFDGGSPDGPLARSASTSRLGPAPADASLVRSASSQRIKGISLNKFAVGANSEDIVNKVQKQMRRLQGHFLVAKLAPLTAAETAGADERADAFEAAHQISYEVVNTRQALLHHCVRHALQFNSLRYAQYSTMMLVHEMLHPSGSDAAHYCLPGCKRGRVDDGSMMVACDACDNWLHPGCLPATHMPASDDSFVCPMCVDAKADVYLQSDCFSEMMMADF